LSGCQLNKAVLIDYDQSNNFIDYQFAGPVYGFSPGTAENGISAGDFSDNKRGFWATFIVCSVRNDGSKAKTFPFDVHKFYVNYDGHAYYFQGLQPYTYTTLPDGYTVDPSGNVAMNQAFSQETRIGPDTDSFPKGYFPSVNYRFSILVGQTSPG